MSSNRKADAAGGKRGAPFRQKERRGARGADRGDRGERRPEKPVQPARSQSAEQEDRRPDRLWIYGRHAALAAIANPKRRIKRIFATDAALDWIGEARLPLERVKPPQKVDAAAIDRLLHEGAVHQGIAVEVDELPRTRLKEACEPDGALSPVVVLDQVTDPHNIGAVFRSAAAFGARAIVVQDRRTPPLAGALAKAAAGAVETVPCVEVVNIARALEGLKALGYFCAGLASDTDATIDAMPADRPIALVLGAEGAGLRRLVRMTCDGVYAIPIARDVDSLNISNAAAVALYEVTRSTRAGEARSSRKLSKELIDGV